MNKKKCIVLLSGGLDSTVNLYKAVQEMDVLLAISFDYGQRASQSELSAAAKIASSLKVPHQVNYLPFFNDLGRSALVDKRKVVPVGKDIAIDDITKSRKSAQAVWVPNRNGIFLNIAAGYAEALSAEYIVPGFNLEEAKTFPDNSEDFMRALNLSFNYSTANKVTVKCYTSAMTKPEIVNLGQGLGVVWDDLWPCYFTGKKWCGECESCLRTKRAMMAARINFGHLFARM